MPLQKVEQSRIYSHDRQADSVEKVFLGHFHHINKALADPEPRLESGAMQGEAVVGKYSPMNRYLYSLNAQSCVVLYLYSTAQQTGCVVHFDHNISSIIEEVMENILTSMNVADAGELKASMAGGVWMMGGEDIGGAVKKCLQKKSISVDWSHWSFSPCTQHQYGIKLSLDDGAAEVFEHSLEAVENFYNPLHSAALSGSKRGANFSDGLRQRSLAGR